MQETFSKRRHQSSRCTLGPECELPSGAERGMRCDQAAIRSRDRSRSLPCNRPNRARVNGKMSRQAILQRRAESEIRRERRWFRSNQDGKDSRRAFRIVNLHFSPRGEAKCVRGLSGRGASRAAEKGASNTAFKVFHESRITSHVTRIRAFFRVLRPSGGEKGRLSLTRLGSPWASPCPFSRRKT